MANTYYRGPMRIQARPNSKAAQAYLSAKLPSGGWPKPKLRPTEIAHGISPRPLDDLIYHGGKLVPQMVFQNIFLGGQASWKAPEIDFINSSITRAMQDKDLNNVLRQYFVDRPDITCDVRDAIVLQGDNPTNMDENAVKQKVQTLVLQGNLSSSDLDSTIFNLLLPPGAVLSIDDVDSLNGLGGFHGSVHFNNTDGREVIAYYSANVYSQQLPDGGMNGIPAFNASWKDVVGTLYHELNEFRTDADVSDAIANNSNDLLGWMSAQGQEIGDQPIEAASGALSRVFQEVQGTTGGKPIPVQFLYSNAVHGAEGPIQQPHH
jgi:hypothetical protein